MIGISTALVLGVLASAIALGQTPPAASPSGAEAPQAPPPLARGLDLSAIDSSADACTDFYQYACGNWMKDNPIPSDQVRWVRSFSILQERNLHELWQELVRAAAKPASPLEKKYGDFFAACMDVETLQKKGLEPLKPELERIAALKDSKDIAPLLGELAAAGDPVPLFRVEVEPDPRDSKKPILSLSPSGVTLLDRETYGGGHSPYISSDTTPMWCVCSCAAAIRSSRPSAKRRRCSVSRTRSRRLTRSARNPLIRSSATMC